MDRKQLISYCGGDSVEIQDVFKYLYQTCFGCEHLVSDYSRALQWIRQETENAEEDDLPEVEFLGDNFIRVHLKLLKKGVSPEDLCEWFLQSSKKQVEGRPQLENELATLLFLAKAGEIPFPEEELKQKIDDWREAGFPALHHSETFRATHHPAYRVIGREYYKMLPVENEKG